MNAYDEFLHELEKDRFVKILYHVFNAQDWRIRSDTNRYFTYLRVGHEPTLEELAKQWINHGGLDHFWEAHAKSAGFLKVKMGNEDFNHFQVYFMLAHKILRQHLKEGSGHDPTFEEVEATYQSYLAVRMRKQMNPAIHI